MVHYYTLCPGRYWIGDPCYAFPNSGSKSTKWDDVLEVTNCFTKTDCDLGQIKVWADGTMYGDGAYMGSNGKVYPVDAGLLGIIPYHTIKYLGVPMEDLKRQGSFITFKETFSVIFDDGKFTFGDIAIDTSDDEEDSVYPYKEEDDENDEEDAVDPDDVDDDVKMMVSRLFSNAMRL